MVERILVTGASGLVGKRLVEHLITLGYSVNTLGRGTNSFAGCRHFTWDVEAGTFDTEALLGVTAIIHLAGAGIIDKRWTKSRRKEIIDSRVKSAGLLYNYLQQNKHEVKTFISASAVGYYGDCGDETITEDRPAGKGFLAEVCVMWEEAAKQFTKLGIREVRCRIGIVLAKEGGALPELTKSLPFGVAPYFAKTNLSYPWIHLEDVCGIFIHALQHPDVRGAVNTTSPNPVKMKELMQAIVKAKKAKAILMPVLPFAIELAMGEMSAMVLESQKCNPWKILSSGFKFKFNKVEPALKDIFHSS